MAWGRVVLDEAHTIRNPATRAALAATALVATARWAATGTPIINSAADLFGLWRFLRYAPYARRQAFRGLIGDPIAAGSLVGLARLRAALVAVTLRRTKASAGLLAGVKEGGGEGGGALAPAPGPGPPPPRAAATPGAGAPTLPPPLPPVTAAVQAITLSPPERAAYNALTSDARAQLAAGLLSGSAGTARQLTMLMRLRQACIHPMLPVRGGVGRVLAAAATAVTPTGGRPAVPLVPAASPTELAAAARLAPPVRRALLAALEAADTACPMCHDAPEAPVTTPCGHVYCRQCAGLAFSLAEGDGGGGGGGGGGMGGSPQPCQVCRLPVRAVYGEEALARADGGGGAAPAAAAGPNPADPASAAAAALLAGAAAAGGAASFRPPPLPTGPEALASAKLDAVWALLAALDARNRAGKEEEAAAAAAAAAAEGAPPPPPFVPDKAIVFSQFVSVLDILDAGLALRGIPTARVDGTMPPAVRAAAVATFQDPASGVDVIAISLKAGSLGLNLTAANHVLIADPWWAPAVEDQAVDRAHRLGQARPVAVTRFIVSGTVEERVLELQQRKRGLAAAALGGGGGGGGGGALAAALGGGLNREEMRFLFGV